MPAVSYPLERIGGLKLAVKEHQPRVFYEHKFDTEDAWLWNVKKEGVIAEGKLALSNKQARASTRFHASGGSMLGMAVKWGIAAQAGAFRWFGWGHPGARFAVCFYMTGSTVYARVMLPAEVKQVDITASLPANYATAYNHHMILLDKGVARFYIGSSLVAEIEVGPLAPYYICSEGITIYNWDTIAGDMEVTWLYLSYFEPRPSFDPQSQTGHNFAQSVAAGTPPTVAWSYTVPEGKRARVEVVHCGCDTDAVNNVYGYVRIDGIYDVAIAGRWSGIPYGMKDIKTDLLTLLPGGTFAATYRNADTATHVIVIRAFITEME